MTFLLWTCISAWTTSKCCHVVRDHSRQAWRTCPCPLSPFLWESCTLQLSLHGVSVSPMNKFLISSADLHISWSLAMCCRVQRWRDIHLWVCAWLDVDFAYVHARPHWSGQWPLWPRGHHTSRLVMATGSFGTLALRTSYIVKFTTFSRFSCDRETMFYARISNNFVRKTL